MLTTEEIDSILQELYTILGKHKGIQSLDYIPSSSIESPFAIYEESEKVLGIKTGILKPLFKYVYAQCLSYIQRQRAPVECLIENSNWDIEFISRIALFIKGDLNVIYNLRKQLILDRPELLSQEIPFTTIVFSKHSKSPSGWEHRRFCYQTRSKLKNNPQLQLSMMEIVTEQELCRKMAENYPKNYYAWMHRLWLLQFLQPTQVIPVIHFFFFANNIPCSDRRRNYIC
jgi:hypothetical protein